MGTVLGEYFEILTWVSFLVPGLEYSLGYSFGSLVWVQAVTVLVHSEVVERREGLAAHVAPVLHLVLVAFRVFEKRIEFVKRLAAALHYTLVHL